MTDWLTARLHVRVVGCMRHASWVRGGRVATTPCFQVGQARNTCLHSGYSGGVGSAGGALGQD